MDLIPKVRKVVNGLDKAGLDKVIFCRVSKMEGKLMVILSLDGEPCCMMMRLWPTADFCLHV